MAREVTFQDDEDEAHGADAHDDEEPVHEASASAPAVSVAHCVAYGDGLSSAMARQPASFTIEARDETGAALRRGGDAFSVAVRGGSFTYAKVVDNRDGTYAVTYKPAVSGNYTIAVSLRGKALAGSPFPLKVLVPRADAGKCKLGGEALTSVVARESSSFEIYFCDAFGAVTHAEEHRASRRGEFRRSAYLPT